MVSEIAVLNGLNKAIKDRGVTLKWLSDRIGICRQTLRKKLTGENPLTVHDLVAIVEALRLTERETYYIFFDSEFQN